MRRGTVLGKSIETTNRCHLPSVSPRVECIRLGHAVQVSIRRRVRTIHVSSQLCHLTRSLVAGHTSVSRHPCNRDCVAIISIKEPEYPSPEPDGVLLGWSHACIKDGLYSRRVVSEEV